MSFSTISFYKYIPLDTPENLREYLRALCERLSLTGRILIANEGLNAAVSGQKENIEQFKVIIGAHSLLAGITFREQDTAALAHHKLVVRVRDEIVHFGEKVNIHNTGIHLSPLQLQQWHEDQEDFVMVDARNEYEHDVGKFKNAVTLPIDNFREFPAAADSLNQYKDKKLVLYCTGGVRCEKASAYLRQEGFEQVYQVEGGIINYVNQFPNSQWQGGLFVFDDRIVSEVGEAITECTFCGKECEQYHNCHNLDCDTLFIACPECVQKMKMTCSEECKSAPRQRKENILLTPLKTIGIVESYFSKAGIAFVKLQDQIEVDAAITIKGNTTNSFTQHITELRDEQGKEVERAAAGELVTFPVLHKVRKNDVVTMDV